MASLGIYYWGVKTVSKDTDVVIDDQIYETYGEFDRDIPEAIALSMLKDWRDRLLTEKGIVSNYMAVSGRRWVVQWRKPPGAPIEQSPVAISTVVYAIITIAVAVALAYLAHEVAGTAKETYRVLSLLGPENLSMIVQIMCMIVIFTFLSPIMSAMAEIPKRIMKGGE